MNNNVFSGKTREEAVEKALKELGLEEKDVIIKESEQKGGLFQSKKICVEIIKNDDVITFIKEYIKKITDGMGIHVNIEVKNRNNGIIITLYSENNNILIGKMGRTIDALTTIIKQAIHTEFDVNFNFLLDVGEYKEKQQKNLEILAKRTAKEVLRTKIEVKLDPMNSYERRIVHSVLTDFDGICTESFGEEPNRYVVIKPKED